MNELTDVRMRPFDRFFATSSNAVDMSCSKTWFKLFTGGRFSVNVAIPVLSFTDKLTRLFVAEMAWPRTNDGPLTMVFNNGRRHHKDVALRSILTIDSNRRFVSLMDDLNGGGMRAESDGCPSSNGFQLQCVAGWRFSNATKSGLTLLRCYCSGCDLHDKQYYLEEKNVADMRHFDLVGNEVTVDRFGRENRALAPTFVSQ